MSKFTVEECLQLPISKINPNRFSSCLVPLTLTDDIGNKVDLQLQLFKGYESIVLAFSVPLLYGESESIRQELPLGFTRCNYGGKKWYFICSCVRKVRILYLAPRSKRFACRHCHGLTYRSRNLSGEFKEIGVPYCWNEIWEYLEDTKRVFYNGKLTKRRIKLDEMVRQRRQYDSIVLGRLRTRIDSMQDSLNKRAS